MLEDRVVSELHSFSATALFVFNFNSTSAIAPPSPISQIIQRAFLIFVLSLQPRAICIAILPLHNVSPRR